MKLIDWKLLKQEIIIETREIISSDKNIILSEVVDLFLEVIQFQLPLNELSGICTRIPYSLHKILVEPVSRIEKITCFPDVCRIELYLRKVLYLVMPANYKSLVDAKDGLGKIISYLNLNPNDIDYNWLTVSSGKSSNFAEHLLKSYSLRNKESHDCIEWSNSMLYSELRSVLVFLIYATYKHQRILKIRVNPFDVTSYLELERKEIIKGVETIFVPTLGREKISEINLSIKDYNAGKSNGSGYECSDNELNIRREGTIEYLKQTVGERRFFLLGEVGMGKTTTLRNLVMFDIDAVTRNKKESIPIYLELKSLKQNDVLLIIFQSKLGIDIELTKHLLKEGKINFYLDGLNEIENNIKSSILKQIKSLLIDYPKNFFLISCRPNYFNEQFEDDIIYGAIPVFALQRLGSKQIEEFLDKNGREEKEFILQEIGANERLFRIIQVPLLLKILIEIVKKEQMIPSDKGKIFKFFFSNLYDREMVQTFSFDKERFSLLVSYYSFKSRELTDSNTSLDLYDFVIPILNDGKSEFGIEIDNLTFLNKAVDLNILVEDKNEYSFSHEIFQEYFVAEYIHLRKMEHLLINKYLDSTEGVWTEILKFYVDLFEDISAKILFIKTLADIDTLLTSQCIMSTSQLDKNVEDEMISKLKPRLLTKDNSINQIAFDSLIELKHINEILYLYSSSRESELPFLKSRVSILLDLNRENLSVIIRELLGRNAAVYIKEVNNYFLTANELLGSELFIECVSKIIFNSTIKPKHIVDFLRLKPEISLSIEESFLEYFIFEISNFDDLIFFTKKFNMEIKNDFILKYLTHKKISKITMRECHLVYNLINENEQFKKKDIYVFIENYLNSTYQNLMTLSLILISSFSLKNSFSLSQIQLSIVQSKRRNNQLDDFDSYFAEVTAILKIIRNNIFKENIESFKGNCLKVQVIAKWRYHYALNNLLNKNEFPDKAILLPFEESNINIEIGDEVEIVIIYADKINQRLYASQKQLNLNSSQLSFNSENLEIIKVGDKVLCKVEYIGNDINKGIRLNPKGLSKKSVKYFLHNDFRDIELRKKLDKLQEFTVVQLKNIETAFVYPSNLVKERFRDSVH